MVREATAMSSASDDPVFKRVEYASWDEWFEAARPRIDRGESPLTVRPPGWLVEKLGKMPTPPWAE